VIGAGTESEGQKAGDLAYMLAHFEWVVGSRDESFYMLNPDGNNGPELSIFFVRIWKYAATLCFHILDFCVAEISVYNIVLAPL
jgi:hypothetical protein